MPLLIPTIQFDVARTSRSAAGSSSSNGLYLQNVNAHVDAMNERVIQLYPQAAMHSDYILSVESGTDIVFGDQLRDITLIDGKTPWPNDSASQHITWYVVFTYESGPYYLPVRRLFISRVWTQGSMARN